MPDWSNKRNWDELDDDQIITIDDDDEDEEGDSEDSDSYKATTSTYPHTTIMTNDLIPPSETKSFSIINHPPPPTTQSSTNINPPPPPSNNNNNNNDTDENSDEETSQSKIAKSHNHHTEKKRTREKRRRCAITNAVNNLSKVLLRADRSSLVDSNGTPFGYQSTQNRASTINRAARVLEGLYKENEEKKVQVGRLTGLLREVSNGNVGFVGAGGVLQQQQQQLPGLGVLQQQQHAQPSSAAQTLSALLNPRQQVELAQQPIQHVQQQHQQPQQPHIVLESILSLQQPQPQPQPVQLTARHHHHLAPGNNGDVPLSINRSTLENLIATQQRNSQRNALEEKLRRIITPYSGAEGGAQMRAVASPGGRMYTTVDGAVGGGGSGGSGGQQQPKVFLNRDGIPSHVPSSDLHGV